MKERIDLFNYLDIETVVSHGHLKNSCDFKGIGTHDPCNAGARLYQLRY